MANHDTANVFRALADVTRRDILRLLRRGPLTSGQIAEQFDATWPTVSRHLAVLRKADLVMSVRQKQEIYYELNTSVLQDIAGHILDWASPKATGGKQRAAVKRKLRTQET